VKLTAKKQTLVTQYGFRNATYEKLKECERLDKDHTKFFLIIQEMYYKGIYGKFSGGLL
jgi:hypothetical protein